jgi:DNA replication protein DnaC
MQPIFLGCHLARLSAGKSIAAKNPMTHSLKEACRQLRLSGLASSLDLRVQEATSHQLPHLQFLELLLQDELNVRAQRQLERRKKAAGFRDLKPLEDFDWSFNPSIKRSQIFDSQIASIS